jgi:uncharacterized protein
MYVYVSKIKQAFAQRFKAPPPKRSISEQLLRDFEPKQKWLSHDSMLHGPGHLSRVFILQELICTQLESTGIRITRVALRGAAMAHDVSRLDDGLDPEHGTRSAKWIHDNLASKMSPEILDTATYIVHWHVPSDSEAPVLTTELKVLKDADALDRARLGDLNPSYLRTDVAKGMIELAQKLYEYSQNYYDSGQSDTFDSVLNAAKRMGIVE